MNVIIGLGNPGKRYVGTPHNIGFEVVEELARRLMCRWKNSLRFRASVSVASLGDDKVLLVRPRTYMNNSGLCVSAVLRYYKIEPCNMTVVLDDADLDLGHLRIRRKGGSGGHKGLLSVVENVGTEGFTRIRLGVGHDERGSDLEEYVLRPFSTSGRDLMTKVVQRAADAVVNILEVGAEKAMNEYNKPSAAE